MSKIDRAATFRGKIMDRGIAETTNGFPQAVLQLQATQMWNEEEKTWQDWNYDEVDIVAYLVLVGGKGKATVSAKQLMKATGWDGTTFVGFQEGEGLKDEIQFRVEEHTYEGNTTLQVAWVDEYDAEPGRTLKKLEKSDIAKLQAKYAGALTALSGGPKPKSAPPSAPKKQEPKEGPATMDPTPPAGPVPTPEPVAPDGVPQDAPSEPPAPPKPEKPKAGKKAKAIDMNTAWQNVYNKTKDSKTQLEITQAWTEAIKEAGGPEEIGDDWSGIEAAVVAALA
jgi:hypothetical protein